MISQTKLESLIKDAISHDMEDREWEELYDYTPDKWTIWEATYDKLEEQGIREEYLESDGFYWRFRANFDEIKESMWFMKAKEENVRDAYDARQKESNPYGYYGMNKSDFYA